MLYGMGYLSDVFVSADPALSLLNFLPTPILFTGQVRMGKKENLGTVQALFSNRQNISELETVLATNAKHGTIQAAMKKVNSTPAGPSTIGKKNIT